MTLTKLLIFFYLKGWRHDNFSILFNYWSVGEQITKRYSLKLKKRGAPLSMNLSLLLMYF